MDEDDILPEDEDIESPFLDLLFDDDLEYQPREDDDEIDDFGIGGVPAY